MATKPSFMMVAWLLANPDKAREIYELYESNKPGEWGSDTLVKCEALFETCPVSIEWHIADPHQAYDKALHAILKSQFAEEQTDGSRNT